MRMLLGLEGFEVLTALNGTRALEQQENEPADVLITDLFMPDRDGIETITEFRRRWPAIKIIAMSGGGAVAKGDYLHVATDIGANAALRKPFDPKELIAAVRALVAR